MFRNPGISTDDVTLILNQQGEVVRASNFDISFKASVYKEGGRRANTAEDRLWQPIPNLRVSAGPAEFNL